MINEADLPADEFYGPQNSAPPPANANSNTDAEDELTQVFVGEIIPSINNEDSADAEGDAAILKAALSEANAEIARQADAVQRGQADLANLRRRYDDERLAIREQANSRLLAHLLPIVDELDLAVKHLQNAGGEASTEAPEPSWTEGVKLIQRKLAAFLESEGVTRIASLGELFNPELHEAVGMAQHSDAEPGCVVEVLRQGYILHNRVVQVAQVVVNQ